MKRSTNIATPSFGLFNYCWLLHLVRFFKDLHIYHLRIKVFKKKDYSEVAEWETFNWFIAVIKPILTSYRDHRTGTPYVLEDEDTVLDNEEKRARNEAFYDSILNKMLELLEKMNENNYDYKELGFKELYEKQEAKNEFFELFQNIFMHCGIRIFKAPHKHKVLFIVL